MKRVYWILLAVFAAFSIVHLVFCFLENEKLRKITKPFCLLILGIAALAYAPSFPLIYCGAFMGMIGDLFLLKNKKSKYFLIGTMFFIVGHICYYIQAILYMFNRCVVAVPWFVYPIIVAGLLVIATVAYQFNKKIAGPITWIGNFYMPMLMVFSTTGFFLASFLSSGGLSPLGGILFGVGYVFFLMSDCTLVYTTYIKDIRRRDFPIMLTYLLAEALIVTGLIVLV